MYGTISIIAERFKRRCHVAGGMGAIKPSIDGNFFWTVSCKKVATKKSFCVSEMR